MGAKKAKTAQKSSAASVNECPDCGSEIRVVLYAGFGDRGYFWVCEKNGCGFKKRTH